MPLALGIGMGLGLSRGPGLPAPVPQPSGLLRGMNANDLDTVGNGGQEPMSVAADYYIDTKKFNAWRPFFSWEFMQPTLGGALDATAIAQLETQITRVTGKGGLVVIDLHNYMRRKVSGTTYIIGDVDGVVPVSYLVDVWVKLATRPLIKNNPLVIFEIMNEPHDMSDDLNVANQNTVVAAIRAAGAGNVVCFSGNDWTNAFGWTNGNNKTKALGFKDPINNYMIIIHVYPDTGSAGQNGNDVRATYLSDLTSLTTWARTNGKKLLITEIGVGRSTAQQTALAAMLDHVTTNTDVWKGWVYFSGGGWWNYTYSDTAGFYRVDPYGSQFDNSNPWRNSNQGGTGQAATWPEPRVDQYQMNFLRPYLPSDGVANLIPKSHSPLDASWPKAGIATPALAAGDGMLGTGSLFSLAELTGTTVHHIDTPAATVIPLTDYTLSLIVKKGFYDWLGVFFMSSDFNAINLGRFNLALGYGYGFSAGGGSIFTGSTVTNIGGGLYWITMTGQLPVGKTSFTCRLYAKVDEATDDTAFAGTASRIWAYVDGGIMLESGLVAHAPKINF